MSSWKEYTLCFYDTVWPSGSPLAASSSAYNRAKKREAERKMSVCRVMTIVLDIYGRRSLQCLDTKHGQVMQMFTNDDSVLVFSSMMRQMIIKLIDRVIEGIRFFHAFKEEKIAKSPAPPVCLSVYPHVCLFALLTIQALVCYCLVCLSVCMSACRSF